MSFKKTRPYYQTPLSTSKTIDLPSNLLQGRPSTRYKELPPPTLNATTTITPRPNLEPITREHNVLVEEKRPKKNVLYKRLSDIKTKNEELEKYSYSKLLSKMIIVDKDDTIPYNRSIDTHDKMRASSEYSCLRGRLINMEYKQEESTRYDEDKKIEEKKESKKRESGLGDYANRTTRIFRRMYGGSEKSPNFFQEEPMGQKYIYINGKKT